MDKMGKPHIFIIAFLAGILALACKNYQYEDPAQSNQNKKLQEEALIKANKYLIKKDADAIKGYINRQGWDMQETKTGLFYEIYENGLGKKAETDDVVFFSYSLSLLDGTLLYETSADNPKSFLVGQGGVESGLEEGILYLQKGDKARFIIPPHLGHGLLGDEDKIPARAILVYDLHLLDVVDKNK